MDALLRESTLLMIQEERDAFLRAAWRERGCQKKALPSHGKNGKDEAPCERVSSFLPTDRERDDGEEGGRETEKKDLTDCEEETASVLSLLNRADDRRSSRGEGEREEEETRKRKREIDKSVQENDCLDAEQQDRRRGRRVGRSSGEQEKSEISPVSTVSSSHQPADPHLASMFYGLQSRRRRCLHVKQKHLIEAAKRIAPSVTAEQVRFYEEYRAKLQRGKHT